MKRGVASMLWGNVKIPKGTNPETKEFATGLINGINTTFTTSKPYVSGKMTVLLNGLKEYGFTEINDTTIQMAIAPSNIGFTDTLELIYVEK